MFRVGDAGERFGNGSAPSPAAKRSGGGAGLPMKKASAFFMGTRGGGSARDTTADVL